MRIQLDFPEDKVKELKALMEENGIESYKELFNNSLTLFEWAIQEVKNGRSLASVDEQSERYRVLMMPILEKAKQRASQRYAAADLALAGHR
jgi:hypothetical protein